MQDQDAAIWQARLFTAHTNWGPDGVDTQQSRQTRQPVYSNTKQGHTAASRPFNPNLLRVEVLHHADMYWHELIPCGVELSTTVVPFKTWIASRIRAVINHFKIQRSFHPGREWIHLHLPASLLWRKTYGLTSPPQKKVPN